MIRLHVTSSRSRESILSNGLDWRHMGYAPGIAGSSEPEQEGIFLTPDERYADYFVRMNNTGGPADVCEVDGVDETELVESPEEYYFVPRPIPRSVLRLTRTDVISAG